MNYPLFIEINVLLFRPSFYCFFPHLHQVYICVLPDVASVKETDETNVWETKNITVQCTQRERENFIWLYAYVLFICSV